MKKKQVKTKKRIKKTPAKKDNHSMYVLTLIQKILNVQNEMTTENQLFWYRGEGGVFSTPLVPGLYRSTNKKKFKDTLEEESELINYFYIQSPTLLDFSPEDGWDWLNLLQHYNMPTRLLDFSENMLQAIFFAFYSWDTKKHEHPVLYILKPIELNMKSTKKDIVFLAENCHLSSWLPDTLRFFNNKTKNYMEKEIVPKDGGDSPVAIYTRHTNQRISNQAGTFVLFGEYFNSLSKYVTDKENILRAIELKIKSMDKKERKNFKNKVLNELEALGVNEFNTFSDLEHLSNYLKRKHFD